MDNNIQNFVPTDEGAVRLQEWNLKLMPLIDVLPAPLAGLVVGYLAPPFRGRQVGVIKPAGCAGGDVLALPDGRIVFGGAACVSGFGGVISYKWGLGVVDTTPTGFGIPMYFDAGFEPRERALLPDGRFICYSSAVLGVWTVSGDRAWRRTISIHGPRLDWSSALEIRDAELTGGVELSLCQGVPVDESDRYSIIAAAVPVRQSQVAVLDVEYGYVRVIDVDAGTIIQTCIGLSCASAPRPVAVPNFPHLLYIPSAVQCILDLNTGEQHKTSGFNGLFVPLADGDVLVSKRGYGFARWDGALPIVRRPTDGVPCSLAGGCWAFDDGRVATAAVSSLPARALAPEIRAAAAGVYGGQGVIALVGGEGVSLADGVEVWDPQRECVRMRLPGGTLGKGWVNDLCAAGPHGDRLVIRYGRRLYLYV